ncbi:hypothetical protein [Nocardia abscessus]|uniref:hypothetical protein n=1 Tax=Nocardia abscessus TaxID=120957 RepID=UPI0018951C51|nr:hypothetical protein [Nocardia abscessus]MBF6475495.1 hypothetical protein [Nocardia abscessus]
MDATARTHVLAKDLSVALAMAARYPEPRSKNGQDYRLRVAQFLTENDRVAHAISAELGELFRKDPALGHLVEAMRSRGGRKRLAQHLRHTLLEHPHTRECLLSLTQGIADPVAGRTRIGRAVSRSRSSGWFSRKVALVWMNVLIVVPVVFAFLTVWGGFERQNTAHDLSTGMLRVFIVWVLSFLPSWLYVRFLGQRASALWNEYVIHLHRLALDEPRYLPRPPRSSEFYEEWLADGGYLQEEEHNIYRQKFNAYYGRAVSSAGRSDFAVKTETLFPVFLATTVFATCWTAALWDLSFVENPTTVWDILKFGFLGAYAFTVQSLIRRFFQSDLRPSAYASALLRIIVVFTTLVPLYQLIDSFEAGVRSAIAFVVGAFPIVGIYALHRTAAVALRAAVPQLTPRYPLNQIDGLNVWYESRLIEEGIEDMQSLVTANLVDVILHTRVPLGRLMDWIDQAQLYFHLDHSEVTRRERRRSVRYDHDHPSEDPSWTAQLSGSLGSGVRAGTKTRVKLRQLGIRTATDLLIAFPPSQVDPRSPAEPACQRFQHLTPAGIDLDQIRILVRVLDENTDLVPIWNWQRRGARIRAPQETSGRRRINGLSYSPPSAVAAAT